VGVTAVLPACGATGGGGAGGAGGAWGEGGCAGGLGVSPNETNSPNGGGVDVRRGTNSVSSFMHSGQAVVPSGLQ
jgi:hypothetical protein